MFDDLTDEQLVTMRTELRAAQLALATGKQTAEVNYEGTSRKFHPADLPAVQILLNRVIAEIKRRAGGSGGGAIFPMAG